MKKIRVIVPLLVMILLVGLVCGGVILSNHQIKQDPSTYQNNKTETLQEGKNEYRLKVNSEDPSQIIVCRRKDNGETWDEYDLPQSCTLVDYEFAMLEDNEVYLMIYGDQGMGTAMKALYHTMDGGDSWTLQSGVYQQNNEMIETMYYSQLSGICYGNDGLVIASESYRGTGSDNNPTVMCSNDYGVTWKEVKIELPVEQILAKTNVTIEPESIYGEPQKAMIEGECIRIPVVVNVMDETIEIMYESNDDGNRWELKHF